MFHIHFSTCCSHPILEQSNNHSMSGRLLHHVKPPSMWCMACWQFQQTTSSGVILQLVQVLKIWIVNRLQLSLTRNFQRHLLIQRLQLEAGQTADIRHFGHA